MTKKILLIILVYLFLNSELNANIFTEPDKKTHMAIGALTYSACVAYYHNRYYCLLPVIGMAFLKESYDSFGHGHVELRDFAATTFLPVASLSIDIIDF